MHAIGSFDVFLSYAHADKAAVEALERQLQAAGLRVWRDTEEIDTFERFERAIREGLSRSKVLLCWYSATYPQRPYCQWELATAHCADPGRVLVINPEPELGHIWPKTLRDGKCGRPDDPAVLSAIVSRVQAVEGAIPLRAFPDARHWVGLHYNFGSNRFVGRLRELWELDTALQRGGVCIASPGQLASSAGAPAAQVQGLGGMGKTMLAEEYARRFAARWPGGVYRASAAEGASAEGFHRLVLEEIAGSPAVQACQTPVDVRRSLRDHLPQSPYLWLVDDLPEGIGKAAAEAWMPPTEHGHALFTTRSRKIDWLGTQILLEALSPEDAFQLLTRDRPVPEGAERDVALTIARDVLGGHALAVDVAGAMVPGIYPGFVTLLSALREDPALTLADADDLELQLPTGHEASILRTFELSLNRLRGTLALDVLRLASVLAPNQPIPRDLLDISLSEHRPADVGKGAAKLAGASLVHLDTAGNLTLHPVLGVIVQAYYGYEPSGLWSKWIARLLRRKRSDVSSFRLAAKMAFGALVKATVQENPRSCSLLAPHGYHLADDGDGSPEVQSLVLAALWSCEQHNGAYGSAKAIGKRWRAFSESHLGPEHPATLTSMSNLASTLQAKGDLAGARVLQEEALPLIRRILGPEHPDTLANMSNLALTLQAQGDLAGARAMEKEVLTLRRRVLGSEHPITLTSMNNLAEILRAQGDLAGARALHEEVLLLRRQVLGPKHPVTLISMNNLALTLEAQGELVGARTLQKEVLTLRRRVLGAEHPNTLTSMNNFAEILRAQGDLAGARALHEEVLPLRRRVLGPEHPVTLISMHNLGSMLRAEGDLAGARVLQEEVLALRRRILGPEHPYTLSSMTELALTLEAQGNLAGARTLQEEELTVCRRVLGPEHPSTLTSMNNLASMLGAMRDLSGARALHEEVLSLLRRIFGSEHPNTLTSMNNLASILLEHGETARARSLAEEALPVAQNKLGSDHRLTRALLGTLSRLNAGGQ